MAVNTLHSVLQVETSGPKCTLGGVKATLCRCPQIGGDTDLSRAFHGKCWRTDAIVLTHNRTRRTWSVHTPSRLCVRAIDSTNPEGADESGLHTETMRNACQCAGACRAVGSPVVNRPTLECLPAGRSHCDSRLRRWLSWSGTTAPSPFNAPAAQFNSAAQAAFA